MHDIFTTGISFSKLEKVSIGGLKGRSLTHSVEVILDEFNWLYREWQNITFNALDPDPEKLEFKMEKEKFDRRAEILERRLGFVFEQNFEDAHELKICGSLLTRPIIKAQLENHFLYFAEELNNELNAVAVDFVEFAKIFRADGIGVSSPGSLVTLFLNYS